MRWVSHDGYKVRSWHACRVAVVFSSLHAIWEAGWGRVRATLILISDHAAKSRESCDEDNFACSLEPQPVISQTRPVHFATNCRFSPIIDSVVLSGDELYYWRQKLLNFASPHVRIWDQSRDSCTGLGLTWWLWSSKLTSLQAGGGTQLPACILRGRLRPYEDDADSHSRSCREIQRFMWWG